MKNNNLNAYKKLDEQALVEELKALKQELFKLRFSHAMNGLDNPHKIVDTKKNIARVNTILTIKRNGGVVEVKEVKEKTEKKAENKTAAKKTTTAKKTTKKSTKKEEAEVAAEEVK